MILHQKKTQQTLLPIGRSLSRAPSKSVSHGLDGSALLLLHRHPCDTVSRGGQKTLHARYKAMAARWPKGQRMLPFSRAARPRADGPYGWYRVNRACSHQYSHTQRALVSTRKRSVYTFTFTGALLYALRVSVRLKIGSLSFVVFTRHPFIDRMGRGGWRQLQRQGTPVLSLKVTFLMVD